MSRNEMSLMRFQDGRVLRAVRSRALKGRTMKNNYGNLLEPWKMDLALKRARKRRFGPDELEDAQQDLIQAMLNFKYEPARSNGATETTVITALIDNRLSLIRRGQTRRRKHEDLYRETRGSFEGKPIPDKVDPIDARAMALEFDMDEVMDRLTTLEQVICIRLSRGDSRLQISIALRLSRYALDRLIKGLREKFEAWGFDSWLGGQ